MATADLVVVGLANPDAEYRGTRHNVGGDAVRLLARRHQTSLKAERGTHAETALVRTGGRTLVLAVPQTYMNDSGLAVRALVRRYLVDGDSTAFDPDALVVVHDELDLEPGVVRVKLGGGTAGNNGLKSLHSHLKTLDFVRVRIGIGKPPGRSSGADYVLRRPSKHDRELLDVAVEVAADAAEAIAASGPEAAMNRYNTKT